MIVQELIEELNKIPNKNLDVVILSDNIDFKVVDDVHEDELGYSTEPTRDEVNIRHCIRLQ